MSGRGPLLAVRQETVLRAQFPGWRIRRVCMGEWIAARHGTGVIVGGTAYELREELRRAERLGGGTADGGS